MTYSCRWIVTISLLSCSIVSNANGQDFLKKLEEKIKQKAPSNTGAPPKTEKSEDLPPPKIEIPPAQTPTVPSVAPSSPSLVPSDPPVILQNPFLMPQRSELSGKGTESPVPRNGAVPGPRSSTSPSRVPSLIEPSEGTEETFDPENAGYLGLIVERLVGGGIGLAVVEIAEGSPAWKAGFQVGDRILAVAGNAISDLDQFAEELAKYPAGTPVKFLIQRAGRNRDLTAVPLDRAIAARTQTIAPEGNSIPYSQGRPNLGVSVANLSDFFRRQFGIAAYRGAAVTDVAKGSPAERIGIKPGDCIVELDGQVIQSAIELQDWVARAKPGQLATIGYYRGRGFNQGQVILGSELAGIPNAFPTIDPGMLTPDYVANLQSELERVRLQLDESKRRMRELEGRLRLLENAKPLP